MKRILYLLHCYHNRAGTEEHTKALARDLPTAEFETAILYPESGAIHLRDGRTNATVSFPAESVPFPVTPYRSEKVEAAFREALAHFKPDIIHVQHFIFWPLAILERCLESGAKTCISFHDYYPITPYFTMQGAATAEEALSAEFSKAVFGQDITGYLHERKAVLTKSIQKFDVKVAPSNSLAQFLHKAINIQCRVVPHGIAGFPVPTSPYEDQASPYEDQASPYEGPVRFGYVGSMLPQKGWRSLIAGFLKVRERHPGAELHIFGGGEPTPQKQIPGIQFHGTYEQTDLPRVLSQFSVGVIPSVFAETFCLVLSEMWQAGLPVAASRIGALAERIEDGKNGKLFEAGNPDSICSALCWFLENSEWKMWPPNPVRTLAEMVEEYAALYSELLIAAPAQK